MKATELRIGNFIETYRIGGFFKEHQIATGFEIDDYDGESLDVVRPIQLTEEWLLKFGFGKSDEHQMGHNIGKIGFYYDYHFGMMEIDTEGGVQELPHIKHVHQLQNLYFALTGEELTIK